MFNGTINKIKVEFSQNFTFYRKKQNLPWLNSGSL